ncbi:ladinin-1 isoform X3 [Physeter macrocephalus]|uniref:Ladinin-1 isoform X3 n=1 Tax=Physeter macrocephalus TaxID=9755 RepID=A0A9W2WLA2_PHYMC|nr:ladinin-1 isoform X3 [Physeter catodon]
MLDLEKSLARQWTLEDEEEQERERRRRHRNLSSTADGEVAQPAQDGDPAAPARGYLRSPTCKADKSDPDLSDGGWGWGARPSFLVPPTWPQRHLHWVGWGAPQGLSHLCRPLTLSPAPSPILRLRLPSVEEMEVPPGAPLDSGGEAEGVRAALRARQEWGQRQREVELAPAPVPEQLEAEEGGGAGTGQAGHPPLAPEKELEPLPRRRLSREQWSSWVREEESLAGREPACSGKGGSEKPSAPEKTSAPEKSLDSKEISASKKTPSPENVSVSQKIAVLEKRTILGKRLVLEKTSVLEKLPSPGKTSDSEKRLTSEKAAVFEKTPAPETQLAPVRAAAPGQPQPQPQEQPASAESPSTPKGQGPAGPEQEPPSSAGLREQGSQRPAVTCHLPPITLQMKIPSKEDEADAPSPTQATYSSSLKHSSPRTISFRMSPRREHSEAALTRSISMRLPASSSTLGQKLERYHTAVQRSESVRSPGPSRAELLVAPVDVAGKRHLFEKELVGQGREGPASSRKLSFQEDLRLSGVVTSRLNLWIGRTQASGDQDPQEAQKESAAARRVQWRKKADSSLDAKV